MVFKKEDSSQQIFFVKTIHFSFRVTSVNGGKKGV